MGRRYLTPVTEAVAIAWSNCLGASPKMHPCWYDQTWLTNVLNRWHRECMSHRKSLGVDNHSGTVPVVLNSSCAPPS